MFISAIALAVALQQTSDNYPETWTKIQSAISSTYYARKTREQEMNDRLNAAGEKATKATSRPQFRDVVLDMIAGFKDSHFDYLTKDDQGWYTMDNILGGKTEMPEIGAWFKRTPGGYTVQMVMESQEAAKEDIRKGDIVTQADGKPFEPIQSFDGKDTVQLTLKRNGDTLTKTVHVAKSEGLQMFLDASRSSTHLIEEGGKKIGYFHLWMMINDDFRNATNNAINRFMNSDAFILDLRDGFGGRPERFLDSFFVPGNKLEWSSVGGAGGGQQQFMGYGKPLIVLVNEGSRSAKEVAAYMLKSSHRGLLVGHQTAGNVLGTSPRRVNDWSILEIPMVTLKVDGVTLENNGVKPDIAVSPEIGSDGTDMILKRGIEEALKAIK
jgi:carboxyl-terminal processing protease